MRCSHACCVENQIVLGTLDVDGVIFNLLASQLLLQGVVTRAAHHVKVLAVLSDADDAACVHAVVQAVSYGHAVEGDGHLTVSLGKAGDLLPLRLNGRAADLLAFPDKILLSAKCRHEGEGCDCAAVWFA